MEITVTTVSLAAISLIAVGFLVVLWPLLVAGLRALIRRDPHGPFIPHTKLMRSRVFFGFYAGLGIVLLVAFQPRPFRPPVAPVPVSAAGSVAMQARVASEVAPRVLSGDLLGVVVGVVQPSGTHVYGFGQRGLGAPPPDGATVFEIGEVTRTFTTLLLARMVEYGQVRLDQPVRELLPDSVSVPTRGDQAILVGQLASDVSALPPLPLNLGRSPLEWCPPFADPYGGYTIKMLHSFLSSYDLVRDPGARIEPSDVGMGVLAHALGRVAGAGFDTLVTLQICDRLGMPDTRVALSRSMKERLASGHVVGRGSYRGWRLASPAHRWRYGALTGAGGLCSTANDLVVFLRAQLGLSSSDLAGAMEQTRRPRYRGRGFEAVGMGWSMRLVGTAGGAVVWCHGATEGTRCWIGMDEARQVGVVVLANSTTDLDAIGFDLLRAIH